MALGYINQLERQWLAKKIGDSATVTAQTSITDMRKRYYRATVGAGASNFMGDLRMQWLKKEISNRGGAGSTSEYESDLWKNLVSAMIANQSLVGVTVSKFESENQALFYKLAS
jgi:hypothetical protein